MLLKELGLPLCCSKLSKTDTRALEIYEVHHFPQRSVYNSATKSGGVFAEFILALIRKKIVTSGFPSIVVTDQQKEAFCQSYEDALGVVFKPEKVSDNPGARYAAKIAVNATMGR